GDLIVGISGCEIHERATKTRLLLCNHSSQSPRRRLRDLRLAIILGHCLSAGGHEPHVRRRLPFDGGDRLDQLEARITAACARFRDRCLVQLAADGVETCEMNDSRERPWRAAQGMESRLHIPTGGWNDHFANATSIDDGLA